MWTDELRKHKWMLILCIGIPIVLLVSAFIVGFSNQYIFWLALLLCPFMHFFMHGKKDGEEGRSKKRCH